MSPLEHRSSCLAVVTLMVVAMILIGVMNGLTAHRVSKYKSVRPVLIIPEEKRRKLVLPAFQRVLNKSDDE